MADRVYEATRKRVFRAPRALVWALVSDTNRWDRASGLTPGRYRFKMIDGAWNRTAVARELGMEIEWIEPAYRWIEGRFVHGERRFLKGPVATGGFKTRLEDVDGGTEVVASGYVTGRGAKAAAAGTVMKARFGRALERYLDAIAEVLARDDDPGEGSDPAVVRARRALVAGYDEITSGERTPPNATELEHRAGKLVQAGARPEIVERIVAFLRDRPDEEVGQIRPFELARLWNVDRRDALSAFLRATRAGLVDLRWQINCPVCRVSAGVAGSLEDVGRNVHCEACNIDYDVDFAKHVEAVFTSNPAVREVVPKVYCASSPAFLPHVFAQIRVPPGELFDEPAELPAGPLHLRTLGGPHTADTHAVRPGASLVVRASDDGLAVELAEPLPDADARAGRLRLENRASGEVTVLVERASWSADAVLGSIIATFPDFLDLFATEAPAAGVELSIGEVALLFSDLSGSTALYERIGDAKAYALVGEHFRLMERIVHAHGGAIVKTMGDAVMASFTSPKDALAAALEMIPENERTFGEHGLAVRIGVHAGPCLAVRANDRLDYFGTTVNVTARLEGKSRPSEIVIAASFAERPAIRELLDTCACEVFEADLKGIRETQKLLRVRTVSDPVSPR